MPWARRSTDQIPRRFCAIYTANGMSLPKAEHGIDEWSWFPAKGNGRRVRVRQIHRAAGAIPQAAQLYGRTCYHPNGPKADPHVCSDMWLTGAPLHNPKPGTYNTVGLDQVVALHTKQYCRQPSLVLSIDAGTGFLSRTGTISYNLDGQPIPAENNPRRDIRPPVPRGPRFAEGRARESAAADQAGGCRRRERRRSTGNWARRTASRWTST